MNDDNLRLSRFFKDMYNGELIYDDGEVIKIPAGNIASTTVAKIIFKQTYNAFVNEKTMAPIEQLPEEEKKSLTAECRKTGEFFTNETLTERCKALYVIKFINANT